VVPWSFLLEGEVLFEDRGKASFEEMADESAFREGREAGWLRRVERTVKGGSKKRQRVGKYLGGLPNSHAGEVTIAQAERTEGGLGG